MARPVVCLESGERFPTYADAARAFGLSGTDIRKSVVQKAPVRGLSFRLAYEVDRRSQQTAPARVREVVECEDGRVFPSIVHAAQSIGVNSQTLRRAIRQFQPCKGLYWRLKTEEQPHG